MIMHQVRNIIQMKQNRPIEVNDLLNLINKKEITRLTKENLLDVLNYYQKMSVVFIDQNEKVMFL
jgi:hypothetical protein